MSDLNPLFSIIIPAYNRESLICEALDSVKKQTYRPIEVIVVDDGSTDATADVVREWALVACATAESRGQSDRKPEGNSLTSTQNVHLSAEASSEGGTSSWEIGDEQLKVRYFYQENSGASAARNKGFKNAEGEYIQFHDSDDIMYEDRLSRLAYEFSTNGADYVQTGVDEFDMLTGEVLNTKYGNMEKDAITLLLQGRLWVVTARCALHRDLAIRIPAWDESMCCFEDRKYFEAAAMHARKSVALKSPLSGIRRGVEHDGISSNHKTRAGRECRIKCEQQLADLLRDHAEVSYAAKQAFASRIYGLGFRSNACGWKDLGKQCGELAESLDVKLDALGKRRRLVWKMGRFGGLANEFAARFKR